MTAQRRRGALLAALSLLCFHGASCKMRNTRPYHEPPPPDLQPVVITYVESSGFDTLFESQLVTETPVILVQTQADTPTWGPRLNAWIAAWNMGGRIDGTGRRGTARAQVPSGPATVNSETIREFRLLVDDLLGRVEALARAQASWWALERVRSRRVALLKPYNLRFHLDENKHIQLIFFNGRYSDYYDSFTRAMAAVSDEEEPGRWARIVTCSHCRRAWRQQRADELVVIPAKEQRER
jgi:hypothetical protein